MRVLLAALCALCVMGCCSSPDKKSGPSTTTEALVPGTTDIGPTHVQTLKSQLRCSDPVESLYCGILDKFNQAAKPSPPSLAYFTGPSMFYDDLAGQRKIVEEATFLILQGNQVTYDSVVPENDTERAQVRAFASYFHQGKTPPSTDPIIKFCRTLKRTDNKPVRTIGKSMVFDRVLKGAGRDNHVYVRETTDAYHVIELGPVGDGTKLFFVGTFPKALKYVPAQ